MSNSSSTNGRPRITTNNLRGRLLTAPGSNSSGFRNAPNSNLAIDAVPASEEDLNSFNLEMNPSEEENLIPIEEHSISQKTPMPETNLHIPIPRVAPRPVPAKKYGPAEEIHALRQENENLRNTLQEVHQILEEAQAQELSHLERQQRLEELISERDELINQLQTQVQSLQDELDKRPILKNADELARWADELEKESSILNKQRRALDNDRQQFREDEEALEKQMRDMEISMARERATLARQETELKRLSSEIQHELEMMNRNDIGSRDQFLKYQRKHQDIIAGNLSKSNLKDPAQNNPNSDSAINPSSPQISSEANKDNSSIFRRFFGK